MAHINFGKHLPRRTFLRGLGASIALPLLDGMVPAFPIRTPAPPGQFGGWPSSTCRTG